MKELTNILNFVAWANVIFAFIFLIICLATYNDHSINIMGMDKLLFGFISFIVSGINSTILGIISYTAKNIFEIKEHLIKSNEQITIPLAD